MPAVPRSIARNMFFALWESAYGWPKTRFRGIPA